MNSHGQIRCARVHTYDLLVPYEHAKLHGGLQIMPLAQNQCKAIISGRVPVQLTLCLIAAMLKCKVHIVIDKIG